MSFRTTISVRAHELRTRYCCKQSTDKTYELIPTYKDAFSIKELGCSVQFIRSTQNKISAIKFYFWRTLGIEFKKIN
jgi:hypothetical protein